MSTEILILISTFNGEKYLKQQIDSLLKQTYKKITIIVRDDGSSDKTIEILSNYNIIKIDSNKNIGPKKSFSKLLNYALKHSNAKYFMFCDQDDIWEENKVEITFQKMKESEIKHGAIPLLIHTDLKIVNEHMNVINTSFWKHQLIIPKLNSFNRLIMQNTITGCTSMINKALAEKCTCIPNSAIMHDWWIGLVASKFGEIYFIKDSTVRYRQHNNNTIGAKGLNINISRKIISIITLIFKKGNKNLDFMDVNIKQAHAFLNIFEKELSIKDNKTLSELINIKRKKTFQRKYFLLKNQFLKQGLIRNIVLIMQI